MSWIFPLIFFEIVELFLFLEKLCSDISIPYICHWVLFLLLLKSFIYCLIRWEQPSTHPVRALITDLGNNPTDVEVSGTMHLLDILAGGV